jgi:hypothetical protein
MRIFDKQFDRHPAISNVAHRRKSHLFFSGDQHEIRVKYDPSKGGAADR